MDQITSASPADFHRVRSRLRDGQSVFTDFGSEDLTALLTDGVAVLGSTASVDWGALLIQRRRQAGVMPAPTLAMLRGLALGRGRSALQDVPRLVRAAGEVLGANDVLQVVLYATDAWTITPLIQAGFEIEDRLLFLALTNLQQRKLSPPDASSASIKLRAAQPDDVAGLVQLDAAAFDPIWRLNESELMTLLLSGRLQVAEQDDMLLGYTALSIQGEETAHLARLSVHPAAQGLGIGRTLLHDVVVYARQRLVTNFLLNTQGKNERAQNLYRAYGFRSAGKVVPVLTRTLGRGT